MTLEIEDVKPAKPVKMPDNTAEIAKIDKQIGKLIDLYSVEGISFDEVKARVDKLNADKERLMTVSPVPTHDGKLTKEEAQTTLISAREILLSDDTNAKRQILAVLIQKITLYDDQIQITWNF